MNYTAIPAVVFTHPEIASVGLKEQEAIDNGYTVRTGQFPFRGIGRARARGDVEGWVKMITDAETEKLIGVTVLAPRRATSFTRRLSRWPLVVMPRTSR